MAKNPTEEGSVDLNPQTTEATTPNPGAEQTTTEKPTVEFQQVAASEQTNPQGLFDALVPENERLQPVEGTNYARFKGTGTRMITAKDWEKAGVPDVKATVWSRSNGWAIPASKLTDKQREILLMDGSFVVETNENG